MKIEHDDSIGSMQHNIVTAPAPIAQPSGSISSRLGYTIVRGHLSVPQKDNKSDASKGNAGTISFGVYLLKHDVSEVRFLRSDSRKTRLT